MVSILYDDSRTSGSLSKCYEVQYYICEDKIAQIYNNNLNTGCTEAVKYQSSIPTDSGDK